MAKYDGFTIMNCISRKPWLIPGYFHTQKSAVIDDFEKIYSEPWAKHRRRGDFKIVKVKLVEAK